MRSVYFWGTVLVLIGLVDIDVELSVWSDIGIYCSAVDVGEGVVCDIVEGETWWDESVEGAEVSSSIEFVVSGETEWEFLKIGLKVSVKDNCWGNMRRETNWRGKEKGKVVS